LYTLLLTLVTIVCEKKIVHRRLFPRKLPMPDGIAEQYLFYKESKAFWLKKEEEKHEI
jgi:hypothetical protein